MGRWAVQGVRARTVLIAGAVIMILGALGIAMSVAATQCDRRAVLKEPDPDATEPQLAGVLPGAGQRLANPIGVAWDGSRLFVSESDAGVVAVFDARGRRRPSFQMPAASGVATVYPASICMTGDDLAIIDTAASRAVVVSVSCCAGPRVVRTIGKGSGVGHPTAVACAEGRLYVADASDGTIKVFDSGDMPSAVLGTSLEPRLSFVTGIALAGDSLWAVDSNAGRVVELDTRNGALKQVLSARFGLPRGIAVLPDGRIVIADAYDRRLVFFFRGEQTGIIDAATVPGAGLASIRSLAWDDKRGRLFVADAESGSVVVYNVPKSWGVQ